MSANPRQFWKSGAWRQVRARAFYRANDCCEKCGRSAKTDGAKLEAHHISPFASFPERAMELDNLMILCSWCHSGFHFDQWKLTPEAANDKVYRWEYAEPPQPSQYALPLDFDPSNRHMKQDGTI